MKQKRIFTHVSGKAVKGMQRLSSGGKVRVLAALGTDQYTVVTMSRGSTGKFATNKLAKREKLDA